MDVNTPFFEMLMQLSDEDFLCYFSEREMSEESISADELCSLYGRFYRIYRNNKEFNEKYPYETCLRDMFLVINDAWLSGQRMDAYRIQCSLLLQKLYNGAVTYRTIMNHWQHLCFERVIDQDYYAFAEETAITLINWFSIDSDKQDETLRVVDNLIRSRWSEVWCQHGEILPEYTPLEVIFAMDKSSDFYIHLQKVLTGIKFPLDDEDRALLLAVEVSGLANVHPFSETLSEESVLHF